MMRKLILAYVTELRNSPALRLLPPGLNGGLIASALFIGFENSLSHIAIRAVTGSHLIKRTGMKIPKGAIVAVADGETEPVSKRWSRGRTSAAPFERSCDFD